MQITVRPDRDIGGTKFPTSSNRLVGDRYQFSPSTTTADASFFGEDGPGISDVVDAVNPLCHIPFISSLYEEATGTKVSAVSKIVGGTLLGGPIGFLAAIGNIIFENETGHTVGGAVLAALRGEEPATQLASVASAPEVVSQTTAAVAAPVIPVAEVASPQAERVAAIAQDTHSRMNIAMNNVGGSTSQQHADADTLALFGADAKSAHASYRKAQFTPYLNDVTTSMVM